MCRDFSIFKYIFEYNYLRKYRANDPCNKGIWTPSSSKIHKFHSLREQPFPTLDDGWRNAFQSRIMKPRKHYLANTCDGFSKKLYKPFLPFIGKLF